MRLRVRPGGVVVLGVAAVAALSAPLTSATAATGARSATAATAASAPAVAWPAQVARPAKVSCPRGEELIAPTAGRTDALGVTHLTYEAAPGLVASIPPRGLTAREVTPMMMADLGMKASRPGGSPEDRSGATPGDARAATERLTKLAMRLAKDRTAPEFCRSGVKDPMNTHVYGNGNWAGYAVTESEFGGEINGVTGTWAVPLSGSTAANQGESTWVGVGGGLGGEKDGTGLIQAGTQMEYTSKGDYGYRSWWEDYGSNTCNTTFCGKYSDPDAIYNGEEVTVYVWWDTTSSATFIVSTASGTGGYDVTNQTVAIIYDHTSAEWVDENYLVDGLDYDDPGTVQFYGQGLSGSFGGDESFTSPFAGSYEAVIMTVGKTADTTCDVPGTDTPNDLVLSYPAYASNNTTGGSSDVITCDIPGIDS
jgi:Peptidase A4 family